MQRGQSSYMSNRFPSTEDGGPFSDEPCKTIGRFSVSPPLIPNLEYRRSSRNSQPGPESPSRSCRAVMEVCMYIISSVCISGLSKFRSGYGNTFRSECSFGGRKLSFASRIVSFAC